MWNSGERSNESGLLFSLSCKKLLGEKEHVHLTQGSSTTCPIVSARFLKFPFSFICALRTRKSEISVMKKGSPGRMLSKSSDHRFHLSVHSFATPMLCSYLHANQSRLSIVNTLVLGWYFVG